MQAQFITDDFIAWYSMITETVFENRFKHVDELVKMGANIRSMAGCGCSRSKEIERSQSLCKRLKEERHWTAGLPEGTTIVENIEHIDRGYERLDEMLQRLGGKIIRVD